MFKFRKDEFFELLTDRLLNDILTAALVALINLAGSIKLPDEFSSTSLC